MIQQKINLILSLLLFTFAFVGCEQNVQESAARFKQGVYEVPAGNGYSKTIITRKDSLQIEEYTKNVSVSTDSGVFERKIKRIDTLIIKWKNNFAYTLWMKNPRTDLDKDPMFVQINKVKDSSYNFKIRIGYSKFTTPGTLYIKK